MIKIATQCIHFFLCINVAKFGISVWRFSPHCMVKFTIVHSTNYKTVWKSIVWELLPCTQYVVYYHTHTNNIAIFTTLCGNHCHIQYVVYYHTTSKNIEKCGKNLQSARRKPNYHTRCGKNCHKILYNNIAIIAMQHSKINFLTPLAIFPILLSEIHWSPSGKFPYTY